MLTEKRGGCFPAAVLLAGLGRQAIRATKQGVQRISENAYNQPVFSNT